MNKFAGSVVIEGLVSDEKIDNLVHKCLPTFIEKEKTCLYIFGTTELNSSKELLVEFTDIGKILYFDVSIESEDKIVLLNKDIEGEVHEAVSFEGTEINFKEIVERFGENYEVVSVREAEVSNKFGNKIIKADFIY